MQIVLQQDHAADQVSGLLTVEFVVKEAASSWTGEAGVMPGVHR